MNRALRWYDMITINIYFTGLTTLSQTMTPLVVPLLVQQFVGEAQQGTYYGTIRLWSLMVALLVQSLMGLLSDRSTSRWGRRRPFIFIGTFANLVVITLIGVSASLEGMTGYWTLFLLLLLMMVAANTAHGAVQGLIPDLVPEEQRGRYSGVKALLEVPIPLIIVSFTIGRLIANGQMWAALFVCMGILLATMLITMLAPEKPLLEKPPVLDWSPFIRLGLMTILFTLVILSMGWLVRTLGAQVNPTSNASFMISMGLLGLIAMAIAVAVGVYFSVRLSIGTAARENPNFTWWVVNRLAFLVGSTNLASFAVYFLQGRMGIERELAAKPASQLLLIVGVFILFLSLPSGWLADKFGRKPLVAISGLVAAAGTLVLILAPNMTIIYAGGVLVGAGTGLFYAANWALGTDLVPKEEAGRYLGISNLAGAGAGAVGAYIGGPIADSFTLNLPSQPGIGYVVLYAIYGLLFLFSVLALTKIHIKHDNFQIE
ncbi:MAG TPA: MFS transporter [Anaerolineales bacterium]|nr:MFS transporter [Anaerolineales bacterium]